MAGQPTVDGESPIEPLPLPPGRSHPAHDTYIVQVPKDQVYRVPPPENAVIFEQHCNPGKQKKRKSPCRTCCSLIILVILILIGGAFAAVYFIFKPKNPQFSVEKFQIKNTPSKKSPNAVPQYIISLTAKNPNSKIGLSYRKGGDATLYYDNIPVATGKTPAPGQGKGDSSTMTIGLAGVKGKPMNPEMKKSMNETSKGDIPISFELENEIQVIGKIEGLKVYSMDLIVNCIMKVSSLRSNARVLTQKCKTEKK